MTVVKICGIRGTEEGRVALEAGADWLGFVFYPPSSRNLVPADAARILRELRAAHQAWKAVAVFVEPTVEEVAEVTDLCGFDYVQMAGQSSADTVGRMPIPVIKTLHIEPGREADAVAVVTDNRLGAHLYHLDTHRDGWYGGTGKAFDWQTLRAVGPRCLVAGGLRPDNVQRALEALTPWGVDVSSGVEFPGGGLGKDPERVRSFIQTVRSHDQFSSRARGSGGLHSPPKEKNTPSLGRGQRGGVQTP